MVPRITRGIATPGNASFHLSVKNAPPAALAVLGVSLGRLAAPDPLGILLDLSPPNLLLPQGTLGATFTDATGSASFPLPLPNDPALSCTTIYAQWAVLDPQATTAPGLALNQGATVIIR